MGYSGFPNNGHADARTESCRNDRLRNLEERLGVRLVERTTRSVAPTAAGERLLERLRRVLDEYQSALESAEAFSSLHVPIHFSAPVSWSCCNSSRLSSPGTPNRCRTPASLRRRSRKSPIFIRRLGLLVFASYAAATAAIAASKKVPAKNRRA
jgi:hypothetical protein